MSHAMGLRLTWSIFPWLPTNTTHWAIAVGTGNALCFAGFFRSCSEAVLSRKDYGGSLLQLPH